jgi:hypothetical protein
MLAASFSKANSPQQKPNGKCAGVIKEEWLALQMALGDISVNKQVVSGDLHFSTLLQPWGASS